MTSNATVSVVIPCFNSAKTIERALRSVEHQTTKPHEVLVVDDASSDDTVSVIEQYARSSSLNIRVIKQSANGGPSVTRNAAWNVATGEFIAFLDADGVILEILPLVPFEEKPVLSKSSKVSYALEVSRDWFASRNLKAGLKVSGIPK